MAEDVEVDVSELEAVEQEQEVEQQVEGAGVEEDAEIPVQWRGKSFKEVAKAAADLEKSLSRQGQELGDLRRLTDDIIKAQLKPEKDVEQTKDVDFFENPDVAIANKVSTHPDVLAAKQIAIQVRQEQAKQRLMQLHPDFGNIMQDPQFAEWVRAKPKRIEMLRQAHAYDVDAADELFSTFKELKGVRSKEVSEAEVQKRDKSLKSAAVDAGGSGEGSKKYFSRRLLREMQIKQPSKFAAMRNEIDAAYREGRIKP